MLCYLVCVQPDLGSKYTAWASVGTLIQRDLVLKTHNPARLILYSHKTGHDVRKALHSKTSNPVLWS